MNRENPIHQLVNTPHTTRRVHPAQTQPDSSDSSSRRLLNRLVLTLRNLSRICDRFLLLPSPVLALTLRALSQSCDRATAAAACSLAHSSREIGSRKSARTFSSCPRPYLLPAARCRCFAASAYIGSSSAHLRLSQTCTSAEHLCRDTIKRSFSCA